MIGSYLVSFVRFYQLGVWCFSLSLRFDVREKLNNSCKFSSIYELAFNLCSDDCIPLLGKYRTCSPSIIDYYSFSLFRGTLKLSVICGGIFAYLESLHRDTQWESRIKEGIWTVSFSNVRIKVEFMNSRKTLLLPKILARSICSNWSWY